MDYYQIRLRVLPVAKGCYQGLIGIAVTNRSTIDNNSYVFLYYTEIANTNTGPNEKSVDGNQHILGNRVYRYDLVDDITVNHFSSFAFEDCNGTGPLNCNVCGTIIMVRYCF